MAGEKRSVKRYYRKRIDLFRLLNKIKLWPSGSGLLHGIKTIDERGEFAQITTHCNLVIRTRNSKNSRAARWIRNKWTTGSCKACNIPDWKMGKYSKTFFTQHYGSSLETVAHANQK